MKMEFLRRVELILKNLTVFPLALKDASSEVRFLPASGFLLGLGLFAVEIVSLFFWSPDVASVLVLAAWIIVTGVVNLSAVASSCEKLFGMRQNDTFGDIRYGSLGTVGLVSFLLVVLVKYSFLGDIESVLVFPVLIIVAMGSRALIVFLIRFFSVSRGASAGASDRDLLLSFGISSAAAVVIAGPVVIVVFAFAAVPTFFLSLYLLKRFGSLSSESYSSLTEVSEILLLAGMTAAQRLILFPIWKPFITG